MEVVRRIRALPTTLKVLVTIAAIVGLALAVAQDQETLEIRSAYGAADPAFPSYAALVVGATATSGDTYDVFTAGNEIFEAMLAAIRGARRRINFESYIYGKGRVADEFTAALTDAARRGVTVRLLADAVGAKDMTKATAQAFAHAGIEVGLFNPLRWWDLESLNYRTHRKILVVDGAVAFTGGVGISDQWAERSNGGDNWRDTQVRVTGPAVPALEASFYENWAETGHETLPRIDMPPAILEPRARSLVVSSSPSGGASNVKLLYLLSIAAARRTIDLQSPYFMLDESTWWSLQQARRRGVRIRVLVEGDLTDAKPVKYASRQKYDDLLAAGVEIYEYQPTMMHVKATIVDGVWSIVGSSNFDNRSLELNDEINIGVADAGLARRLTSDFERDVTRCRPLTLDRWRQRPATDKVREWIWSFFGELF